MMNVLKTKTKHRVSDEKYSLKLPCCKRADSLDVKRST